MVERWMSIVGQKGWTASGNEVARGLEELEGKMEEEKEGREEGIMCRIEIMVWCVELGIMV